jgi:hypothetical protein
MDEKEKRWLNARDVKESGKLGTRSGAVATVAVALALQVGCLNDCQMLCNSWYGYQQSVCDEDVEATDLNRCLTDYRTLAQGSGDDVSCRFFLDHVDELEDDRMCGVVWDASGAAAFDLSTAE